jgi:hypothetical protein
MTSKEALRKLKMRKAEDGGPNKKMVAWPNIFTLPQG